MDQELLIICLQIHFTQHCFKNLSLSHFITSQFPKSADSTFPCSYRITCIVKTQEMNKQCNNTVLRSDWVRWCQDETCNMFIIGPSLVYFYHDHYHYLPILIRALNDSYRAAMANQIDTFNESSFFNNRYRESQNYCSIGSLMSYGLTNLQHHTFIVGIKLIKMLPYLTIKISVYLKLNNIPHFIRIRLL